MARAPDAGGGRIVSVSTVLFDGYPMERAIEEIARSGAGHVEPAYIRGYVDFTEADFGQAPAGRLRKRVADAGLSIHAVSAHMDISLPEGRNMLERRIGFAEAIGAKVLITNAGPADRLDRIRATIGQILPRLEAWGGMLAIENPGHGTGDLVGNAREGRSLVDLISSPHVRLNHDAGNVFTYSREALQPAEDYLSAADAVGHVHLKDVRRSAEGWNFCPIGSGDVDLAGYLDAIDPGIPLSLELPLRLTRPGRGDPRRSAAPRRIEDLAAALASSLDYVRRHARGRQPST